MSHLPPGQILRNSQGRIRRPTSAYFLWMLQARDRIRRENPHLATIPLMLEAGRQWRTMPRDQKQVWINQAEANRLRYRNLFGRTRYPRAARRRQRLQQIRNRQQQLQLQRQQAPPAQAPAATAPAPAPGSAATAPAPAPGTAANAYAAPAPAPGSAATAPAPAPGPATTAPPPGSSSSAPPISLAPPRVDSN